MYITMYMQIVFQNKYMYIKLYMYMYLRSYNYIVHVQILQGIQCSKVDFANIITWINQININNKKTKLTSNFKNALSSMGAFNSPC